MLNRIIRVEGKVENVRSSIAVDGRRDRLEIRFDAMEKRMDGFQSGLDAVNGSLQSMNILMGLIADKVGVKTG